MKRFFPLVILLSFPFFLSPAPSKAWFDETHVAIAKTTGYPKWFNAVGPDMIRIKIVPTVRISVLESA